MCASAIPARCKFERCDKIVVEWAANRNMSSSVLLGFSHCKQCYQEKIPARPGQEGVPAWRRQTHFGCSHCAVNLCSWACFRAWDHVHCCARRELTLQYAREKDVVGPPTEPRARAPPRACRLAGDGRGAVAARALRRVRGARCGARLAWCAQARCRAT